MSAAGEPRLRVVVVSGDVPAEAAQLAMVDIWPAGDGAAVEWSMRDDDDAPVVLAALEAARQTIEAALT